MKTSSTVGKTVTHMAEENWYRAVKCTTTLHHLKIRVYYELKMSLAINKKSPKFDAINRVAIRILTPGFKSSYQ